MKRVLWIGLGVIVACVAAAIAFLNSMVAPVSALEQSTKQAALAQTPMRTIQRVSVYTGGPTSCVAVGTDASGKPLFATVTGPQVNYSYFSDGISQRNIVELARKECGITKIIHATPGPVTPDVPRVFSADATGLFVWEVYGTTYKGQHVYAYFDFPTGKLLWTYRFAI